MATYYRPNLTAQQRARLIELLEDQINCRNWDDPQFDFYYRLILKLKDCKEISTDKRQD